MEDNSKPSYRLLRLEVNRDAEDLNNQTIEGNRADYMDALARQFAIGVATRENWADSLEWIAFGDAASDDTYIEKMVIDLLIVDKDVMDGIKSENQLVENTIDKKFVSAAKQGDLTVEGFTIVKSYMCSTWVCEDYEEIKPLSPLVIGDGPNAAEKTQSSLKIVILVAVFCIFMLK